MHAAQKLISVKIGAFHKPRGKSKIVFEKHHGLACRTDLQRVPVPNELCESFQRTCRDQHIHGARRFAVASGRSDTITVASDRPQAVA